MCFPSTIRNMTINIVSSLFMTMIMLKIVTTHLIGLTC